MIHPLSRWFTSIWIRPRWLASSLADPCCLLAVIAVFLTVLACGNASSGPPSERTGAVAQSALRDDATQAEDLTPAHQALLLHIQHKQGGSFETDFVAGYLLRHVRENGFRGEQDLARAAARGIEELKQFQPTAHLLSAGKVDAITSSLGAAGALLSKTPQGKAYGLALQALSYTVRSLGRTADPGGRGEALLKQGRYAESLQLARETTYVGHLKLCEQSPEYAAAFSRLHLIPRLGGVSANDSIDQLRTKNSELTQDLVLDEILDLLKEGVVPTLERVELLAEQNRAGLSAIVEDLKTQAQNAEQARSHQERLDAARTVGRGLALIFRKSNPEAAAKIGFVTTAAVSAVDTFVRLKSTNPALHIGRLAAATNFVGIALSALEMFGKQSGPDPWLVQELQAIHATIRAGFQEMREAFEHLDHRLDDIEQQLEDGFGKVRADLAGVHSEVEQSAEALVELSDRIQGLEVGILSYLEAVFAVEYAELVDSCADFEARTGFVMQSGQYASCESGLFVQAKHHASSTVLAGSDCSTIDAVNLADTLALGPPARNMRCVLTFLQRLGVSGLHAEASANLRHVVLAIAAYGDILLDNPEYAERLAPSRIDELIESVHQLRATIVGLSVMGQGEATTVNTAPWSKAFDYGQTRIDELALELAAVEGRSQQQLAEHARAPFDLWAGVDALPPSPPALTGMERCSGAGTALSIPSVLNGVPAAVQLAGYLGQGLTVCYRDVQWTDTRSQGMATYSRLSFSIEVRRGEQSVARHTFKGPEYLSSSTGVTGCVYFYPCVYTTTTYDPLTTFTSKWEQTLKPAFEAAAWVEALSVADQQSALEAARTFNAGELRTLQSQVYLETAQEAEKPTPLRDAIRRLEGADGLQRNLVTLALADELGSDEDLHAATSGGVVVSYTPERIAEGYRDAVLDVGRSLVLPVRVATLQAIQAQQDSLRSATTTVLNARAEAAKTSPAPVSGLDLTLGRLAALRSSYGPFETPLGSQIAVATMLARVEFGAVVAAGPTQITPATPPILAAISGQPVIHRAYKLSTSGQYSGAAVCLRATREPAAGERHVIVAGPDWRKLTAVPRPLMSADWSCTEELAVLPSDVGLATVRNRAPTAVCLNQSVKVPAGGAAEVSAEDLAVDSVDPDGDALTFTLNTSGPFAEGLHQVVVTVSDGLSEATCASSIAVTIDAPDAGVGGATGAAGSSGDGGAPGDSGNPGAAGTSATAGSTGVAGTQGGIGQAGSAQTGAGGMTSAGGGQSPASNPNTVVINVDLDENNQPSCSMAGGHARHGWLAAALGLGFALLARRARDRRADAVPGA